MKISIAPAGGRCEIEEHFRAPRASPSRCQNGMNVQRSSERQRPVNRHTDLVVARRRCNQKSTGAAINSEKKAVTATMKK